MRSFVKVGLVIVCIVIFLSLVWFVGFYSSPENECKRFLNKYQEDLLAITQYVTTESTRGFYSYDEYGDSFYKNCSIPDSVEGSFDRYFQAVEYGRIYVLNEDGKWHWDMPTHTSPPNGDLVAFYCFLKPYGKDTETGNKMYASYSLYYTTLSEDELTKFLAHDVLSSYAVSAIQENWYFVVLYNH